MPIRSLACAALVIALSASPAAADPDPARERAIHFAAIAAGIALYVSSETIFKDEISPDQCRWCAPPDNDRRTRNALVWENRSRAARLSDLGAFVAAPVAAIGFLATASDRAPRWTRTAEDLIVAVEAVLAAQLLTQVIKISAGRQRPYAHFTPELAPPSQEDNLSFSSGHSSSTFSIAASAGTIAQLRGYRIAPAIWATGLALAGTTAYLRIAADRHYLTDVVAGAVLGTAIGILYPRLMLERFAPSSAPSASLTPTGNGLALTGTF